MFVGDLQNKDFKLITDNFDYYVKGNSDFSYEGMEDIRFFEFEGIKFLLTHGHLFGSLWKKIDFNKLADFGKQNKVDIIIYGHDHIKNNKNINNVILFNPGSISFPRDGFKGSYGVIEIENQKIKNITHKIVTF